MFETDATIDTFDTLGWKVVMLKRVQINKASVAKIQNKIIAQSSVDPEGRWVGKKNMRRGDIDQMTCENFFNP